MSLGGEGVMGGGRGVNAEGVWARLEFLVVGYRTGEVVGGDRKTNCEDPWG